MGTGTDVEMETAGITLMRSDLRLVPEAITLAQLIAGAAMALSSLSVREATGWSLARVSIA